MNKWSLLLSNPNTYHSIIYLLSSAGIALKPDAVHAITSIGFGLSGALHAFVAARSKL